jgi:hypothetical protein
MKCRAIALCAGLLLLGLMPGSALAKATVDQQNVVYNAGFGGAQTLAQTFTVGRTGTMTQVDLYISESPAKAVTVHIQAVPVTYPFGNDLASGSSASVNAEGWYSFSLFPAMSVTTGQKYAIVFNLGATGDVYGSTSADEYAGGQALLEDPSWSAFAGTIDFDFKTYVEAPAPTPTPPTPTFAPGATATPSAKASIGSTDSTASVVPSATDTSGPTPSPAATEPAASLVQATSATPSPQPDSGSGSSAGSSGSTLPIVLAGIVALGLVLGGVSFVLVRRRRQAIG